MSTFRSLPITLQIKTQHDVATPVVLRGTPLPASREKRFSTVVHDQRSVELELVAGESPAALRNLSLGTLIFDQLTTEAGKKPELSILVTVTEQMDIAIQARDIGSDRSVTKEISDAKNILTKEAVEELLKKAIAFKAEDEQFIESIEAIERATSVLERAEQYLSTSKESKNSQDVERFVAALGLALEADDHGTIRTISNDLTDLLNKATDISLVFDSFFNPRQSVDIFRNANQYGRRQKFKPSSNESTRQTPADSDSIQESPARLQIGKIFGGGEFQTDESLCFVIMPFSSSFDLVYTSTIQESVISENLTCLRADEIHGPEVITRDIWISINKARLIVADLTGKNANVFYELGIAHALGKDVILMTQTMDDVPFDLKSIRCIVYTNSNEGRSNATGRLRLAIRSVVK